jgi:hypothetical protein
VSALTGMGMIVLGINLLVGSEVHSLVRYSLYSQLRMPLKEAEKIQWDLLRFRHTKYPTHWRSDTRE